jgi:hypothetical protein
VFGLLSFIYLFFRFVFRRKGMFRKRKKTKMKDRIDREFIGYPETESFSIVPDFGSGVFDEPAVSDLDIGYRAYAEESSAMDTGFWPDPDPADPNSIDKMTGGVSSKTKLPSTSVSGVFGKKTVSPVSAVTNGTTEPHTSSSEHFPPSSDAQVLTVPSPWLHGVNIRELAETSRYRGVLRIRPSRESITAWNRIAKKVSNFVKIKRKFSWKNRRESEIEHERVAEEAWNAESEIEHGRDAEEALNTVENVERKASSPSDSMTYGGIWLGPKTRSVSRIDAPDQDTSNDMHSIGTWMRRVISTKPPSVFSNRSMNEKVLSSKKRVTLKDGVKVDADETMTEKQAGSDDATSGFSQLTGTNQESSPESKSSTSGEEVLSKSLDSTPSNRNRVTADLPQTSTQQRSAKEDSSVNGDHQTMTQKELVEKRKPLSAFMLQIVTQSRKQSRSEETDIPLQSVFRRRGSIQPRHGSTQPNQEEQVAESTALDHIDPDAHSVEDSQSPPSVSMVSIATDMQPDNT